MSRRIRIAVSRSSGAKCGVIMAAWVAGLWFENHSIIRDMIERLALSDMVLADVSIPNANVFYEVGVRHAGLDRRRAVSRGRAALQRAARRLR